ncbi:prolipoprotein diacylglyceryl transferase [Eubacteriales bacterium OttesenSCG-928-M02]|nr:prolipoprotein diacylglyceryl transferase [Eubacteriales bacterium OttesenSCG-928-M02]
MANNIAFSLFGVNIYWYSILIMCGTVIGMVLSTYLTRKRGYNSNLIIDVLLLGIPLGIIGARLYFVVFNWAEFAGHPERIFTLQMEGLAIYGAVIGGLLAVFILSKWKKVSFWDVTDAAVPSLILAQAIGRWGNFFNQELYGKVIEGVSGQVGSHLALFPPAVFIDATGTWHSALFLYESVWNLFTFAILLVFYFKKPDKRGCTTFLYFVLYCAVRTYLEGLRLEHFSLMFLGMRVSQVVSGIATIVALFFFIRVYRMGGYSSVPIPADYLLKPKEPKKGEAENPPSPSSNTKDDTSPTENGANETHNNQ